MVHEDWFIISSILIVVVTAACFGPAVWYLRKIWTTMTTADKKIGFVPNDRNDDRERFRYNSPDRQEVDDGGYFLESDYVFETANLLLAQTPDHSDDARKGPIVVVGLDGSGKTSLLYRLRNPRDTFIPKSVSTSTICRQLVFFSFGGCKYQAIDLGGIERVRHHWKNNVPKAKAVIFMIDGIETSRLATVRKELHKVVFGGMRGRWRLFKRGYIPPLVIMLNKCDSDVAIDTDSAMEHIDYTKIKRHLGSENVRIFPVSVKDGRGYEPAIRWVTDQMENE